MASIFMAGLLSFIARSRILWADSGVEHGGMQGTEQKGM
jgi:hypothetical protein